jgi:hypothetical protein
VLAILMHLLSRAQNIKVTISWENRRLELE